MAGPAPQTQSSAPDAPARRGFDLSALRVWLAPRLWALATLFFSVALALGFVLAAPSYTGSAVGVLLILSGLLWLSIHAMLAGGLLRWRVLIIFAPLVALLAVFVAAGFERAWIENSPSWVATALALGFAGPGVLALMQQPRGWRLGVVSIACALGAGAGVIAGYRSWTTAALVISVLVLWVSLVIVAIARVIRPAGAAAKASHARVDQISVSLAWPRRLMRALAGARLPLAAAGVGALAAFGAYAHHQNAARALPAQAAAITALAYSADGQYLAIASEDGAIEVRRAAGLGAPLQVDNGDGPVHQLLFDTVETAGGSRSRLIYATALGRVRGIDPETGAPLLPSDVFPESFSPPLLSLGGDGSLLFAGHDAQGGVVLRRRLGDVTADMAPDESSTNGEAPRWSRFVAAAPIRYFADGEVTFGHVALSASGGVFAVNGERGGFSDFEIPAGDGFAFLAASSLEDAIIVAGGDVRRLSYPDAIFKWAELGRVGACPGRLLAHAPIAYWIADERRDGLIQKRTDDTLSDAEAEELAALRLGAGLERRIITAGGRLCTISPEGARDWRLDSVDLGVAPSVAAFVGERIVLGLADGSVRIADAQGRIVGRMGGHGGRVTQIAATPDGRRVALGAEDGSVQILDLTPSGVAPYAASAEWTVKAGRALAAAHVWLVNAFGPIAPGETPPEFRTFDPGDPALLAITGAWASDAAQCATAPMLVRVGGNDIEVSEYGIRSGGAAIGIRSESRGLIMRIENGAVRLLDDWGAEATLGVDAQGALERVVVNDDVVTAQQWIACPPTSGAASLVLRLGSGAPLEAAIPAAATRLGVEEMALRALLRVEGGAAAFGASQPLSVRYHPHLFARATGGRFNASHSTLSKARFDPADAPVPEAEHQRRFQEAAALDGPAAFGATAFGPFKLLGANHATLGYANAAAMAIDAAGGGERALAMLERFLRANNLVESLAAKDWAAFARGYNGPGQVEAYAARLDDAYLAESARRDPAAFIALLRARDADRLSDSEIQSTARVIGIEPEVLRAIMRVESAGAGFAGDGRPLITFEPYRFSQATQGRYDRSNPNVSQPTSRPSDVGGTQAARWTRLMEAYALDPEAALGATSFGVVQMPGRHFEASEAQNVFAFTRRLAQSELDQVQTFGDYLASTALIDELQRRDWAAFARAYRGENGAAPYTQALASAYEALIAARPTADTAFLDTLISQDTRALTDADFQAAVAAANRATGLNIEWEALAAAAQVESGGRQGYGPDGRLTILFEPHIFSRRTSRQFDATNPNVSYPAWDASKYPRTQAGRWAQLREAYRLNPEEALASASYGLYQIMGYGCPAMGYPNIRECVTRMSRSNVDQLEMFVALARANNILDELDRKDWDGFALGYNGAGQVERYGRLLREAYDRLKTPPA